jgi:uncharacterized protein YdeI (YjbR/CyaY-like superfamily)
MKMQATLYAQTRQEWRDWLEQHYQSESEVWLIFYKAHTKMPCISYDESVEEALCFGWIDSIIQKIDEERYGQKFTPRKNTAKWSESNKRRVARLIREGRMTEAGLAKIPDHAAFLEDAPAPKPKELSIPQYVEQELKKHPLAWVNFCNMAPSYRRIYIGWITDAKKQETIDRRLQEAIERLEKNLPLGMK